MQQKKTIVSRRACSWRLQGRCNCLPRWWLLASRYWMA